MAKKVITELKYFYLVEKKKLFTQGKSGKQSFLLFSTTMTAKSPMFMISLL